MTGTPLPLQYELLEYYIKRVCTWSIIILHPDKLCKNNTSSVTLRFARLQCACHQLWWDFSAKNSTMGINPLCSTSWMTYCRLYCRLVQLRRLVPPGGSGASLVGHCASRSSQRTKGYTRNLFFFNPLHCGTVGWPGKTAAQHYLPPCVCQCGCAGISNIAWASIRGKLTVQQHT